MRRFILLTAAVVLAVSGCSRLAPYARVARGNREYSGGDYQSANIAYIEAGKTEQHEMYVAYNLGTVYYALGEALAAEKEWLVASATDDPDLLYKAHYNLGVLYYDRGAYRDAYEKFRNALEINPAGLEAKLNLELTIEKLEVEGRKDAKPVDSAASGTAKGEVDRILNYLRRIEGEEWESTEDLEYTPLPRDL